MGPLRLYCPKRRLPFMQARDEDHRQFDNPVSKEGRGLATGEQEARRPHKGRTLEAGPAILEGLRRQIGEKVELHGLEQ